MAALGVEVLFSTTASVSRGALVRRADGGRANTKGRTRGLRPVDTRFCGEVVCGRWVGLRG